jgi:hypothetical protein
MGLSLTQASCLQPCCCLQHNSLTTHTSFRSSRSLRPGAGFVSLSTLFCLWFLPTHFFSFLSCLPPCPLSCFRAQLFVRCFSLSRLRLEPLHSRFENSWGERMQSRGSSRAERGSLVHKSDESLFTRKNLTHAESHCPERRKRDSLRDIAEAAHVVLDTPSDGEQTAPSLGKRARFRLPLPSPLETLCATLCLVSVFKRLLSFGRIDSTTRSTS